MFDLPEGDVISGNIAFNGFYELALSRRIVQLARTGGLLVDVGANMGYFSLLWCANNPHARAMAYEASPRVAPRMASNIQKNNFTERISLVEKAASKEAGVVEFSLGPGDQTGWGGIAARGDIQTVSVPAIRLDEELNETVDVLKIDVEGADTFVLYGCEKLLKKKLIKMIFFERNSSRMAELNIDQDDAQRYLGDLNYVCEPLDDAGNEWMARPA
ncbi:MAG TPA: FkbM family methyltransferase [Burkholderiales bacterium]|jgi:FkbM family methyltransferase|nr:FkbM family methyltransferase [Burkholderiales bacterium]